MDEKLGMFSGMLLLGACVPILWGFPAFGWAMWFIGAGGLFASVIFYKGSGWDIP